MEQTVLRDGHPALFCPSSAPIQRSSSAGLALDLRRTTGCRADDTVEVPSGGFLKSTFCFSFLEAGSSVSSRAILRPPRREKTRREVRPQGEAPRPRRYAWSLPRPASTAHPAAEGSPVSDPSQYYMEQNCLADPSSARDMRHNSLLS